MDPNTNLDRLLRLAESVLSGEADSEHAQSQLDELAELLVALDGWLKAGGFLPSRWAVPR